MDKSQHHQVEPSTKADQTATDFPVIPSAASGKPYDWSLPQPDTHPLIALPPEAMAERTDADTAAIFNSAVERTAAFFVVVSRNNGYEGRDPAVITEDLHCGLVAGMLGIDIDMLAGVLVELKSRGLVDASTTGGLELRNIDALDQLSEST
jgi:CRP/FNR family transcriptional regulator, anaerobic regulatory protein